MRERKSNRRLNSVFVLPLQVAIHWKKFVKTVCEDNSSSIIPHTFAWSQQLGCWNTRPQMKIISFSWEGWIDLQQNKKILTSEGFQITQVFRRDALKVQDLCKTQMRKFRRTTFDQTKLSKKEKKKPYYCKIIVTALFLFEFIKSTVPRAAVLF